MRKRPTLAAVAFLAMSVSQTIAATPTTAPATQPAAEAALPFIGQFEYRYPGIRLHVEAHDTTHLSWTILEGGPAGASETVAVDRREVAPNVFFTSWTEKSGAMATQVANYNLKQLTTVLIFNGQRIMLEGQIIRLPG